MKQSFIISVCCDDCDKSKVYQAARDIFGACDVKPFKYSWAFLLGMVGRGVYRFTFYTTLKNYNKVFGMFEEYTHNKYSVFQN